MDSPYHTMTDDDTQTFAFAPMSPGIRTATWLVLSLLTVTATLLPVFTGEVRLALVLIVPIVVLTFALVYLFYRPITFTVGTDGLTIHWPLRQLTIPHDAIVSVRRLPREEMGRAMRLVGAGGLFGSFGLFRSKHLGNFTMYASNSDGLVLITRHNVRPLVISPDDPDAFVAAVNNRILT